MTTIVLLIIAGVVAYYFYITLQEYLKNPMTPQPAQNTNVEYDLRDDPYMRINPIDKLKNSYAGVSIRLLNKMLMAISQTNQDDTKQHKSVINHSVDSSIADSTFSSSSPNPKKDSSIDDSSVAFLSLVQQTLIEHFIKNLSTTLSHKHSQDELFEMIGESDEIEISELANMFLNQTYGEYKKRVNFVGFLLMLGWSDGELGDREREVVIDIAAYLEIDNSDFNALYESFEAANEQKEIKHYEELFNKQIEAQEDKILSDKTLKEIFNKQAISIINKAQKSQESQKALLDKLLDLQTAFEKYAHRSFRA